MTKQGIGYVELKNKPSPLNVILWSANVETEHAFLIGYYSLLDSKPIQFVRFPKNHHLLGNLREEDKIRRMIAISEHWYTISRQNGALYFNDLRFGTISISPSATDFVFSYKIDATDCQIKFIERPRGSEDAKKLLGQLWRRMKGN